MGEFVRLGSVCFFDLYSLSDKTDKEYEFEYISLSDVEKGVLLNTKRCQFAKAPSRARRKVRKGDVLLATVRPNLQAFYLFKEEVHDTIVSTGFCVLTPQSELLAEYLHQYLFSEHMLKVFHQFNVGTNYPAINSSDIKNFPIFLPPLSEQKAIADILQTWDTAIEKTEALIAAKEKQFSWLRSSMIRNAKNTTSVHFRDLLTESRIVDKQNDVQKRLTVRLHLKGVDIRDFRGTESEEATQYYIRKSGQLIYGKQNVFRGSIGIIPKKLDGYSSSQDIPAFDIAESIYADWLFWYMSRPVFYKKLEHFAAGSGSKRFHPKELFKLAISTPPLSEQKRIAHTLNTARQEIDTLKTLADQYRTQKRGLMQKLLTGKWRVKL